MNICDAIVAAGLETSKGNAKKAVEAGSIYVNEVKIDKIDQNLTQDDLIGGKAILVRK